MAPKRQSGASDLDPRLDALHKRLEKARGFKTVEEKKPKPSNAAIGMAFRVTTEFVAGLAVGGIIGWQVDAFFGTKPWFLVVFLLMGAAAALLNVIRAADRLQASQAAAEAEAAKVAETGAEGVAGDADAAEKMTAAQPSRAASEVKQSAADDDVQGGVQGER